MRASSLYRVAARLRALSLLAALAFAVPAAADTFAYPTTDDAQFYVDVPSDWEAEPAEEAGGFINLTGPSGVLVSLRTVQADEYSVDDVIAETREFLTENYADVEFAPLKHSRTGDYTAVILAGVGDNEGTPTIFSNVFYDIDGKFIAEIRLAVDDGDEAGMEATKNMLNTFRLGN